MPPILLRLFYRVAAPLAHVFFALTRVRLRGAKCLLVRGEDAAEVLLVRHTYGDRRKWHLPGGLLKRGEDPVDGARRELREEVGLEFADPRELCVLDVRLFGHVDRVHFFLCALGAQLPELAPRDAEIAETGWFALERPPRALAKEVREVLALLESQHGKPGSPAGAERAPAEGADPST